MIPLRSAALYTAGLLVAFAAGWFLKPAPAPAGQSAGGVSRKIAPPTSLAGRPVGTAGETWLDAAAADAAAVREAARPGEANQVLVEKLRAALLVINPAQRQARWSELMPLMRMEDAAAIGDLLKENLAEGRAFPPETTAFWQRCGQMDPGTALKRAQGEGERAISDVLGGWACRDSTAAVEWIRANAGRESMDPQMAIKRLMDGLAGHSRDEAVRLLLANAEDPIFKSCLGMATDLIIQHVGIVAAQQWFSGVGDGGAPDVFKTANLETLLSYGGARAGEFGPSRRRELAETVAGYAGQPWFSPNAASELGYYMGGLDPLAGMPVMESFQNALAKQCFADSFLAEWLAKDAALMGDWLKHNPSSPSFDLMAARLAAYLADEHPQAARNWAAQITDPTRREAMEKQLSGDQEPAPDDTSSGQ